MEKDALLGRLGLAQLCSGTVGPGKNGKIASKPVTGTPGPSKSRAVFITGNVFELGAVPCWKKQKPCPLEVAQTALAGRCWWLVTPSERLVSSVLEKLPLHGQ